MPRSQPDDYSRSEDYARENQLDRDFERERPLPTRPASTADQLERASLLNARRLQRIPTIRRLEPTPEVLAANLTELRVIAQYLTEASARIAGMSHPEQIGTLLGMADVSAKVIRAALAKLEVSE